MSYEDDLALALELADAADAISLERFFAHDLQVSTKPDLTPVSDADLAVEDAIRAHVAQARPNDSVLGEERSTTGSGDRQWIIDPIDGTKNFVRGVPIWATLIALTDLVDGVATPVVGVVSAPALGRRWWAINSPAGQSAAFAGGALRPTSQIAVSQVAQLADASISYASLGGWAKIDKSKQFGRLLDGAWRTRGYGDFLSYMLVAEGAVDIAAEPELALYDMAALVPIVEAAGGRFTSLDGERGPWGGNAVATNGLLHEDVLAALR